MENLKTMVAEIRILVVSEIADRLAERMAELKDFEPSDEQLSVMAKVIDAEVKDNTLEQIEASIDVEIDLSVDLLWDEVLDKWNLDVIDDDEIPDDKFEEMWKSDDVVMIEPEYEEYEKKHARPLSESKEPISCPGCCDMPDEKINEKEGIQTHIVDMEW